MRIDEGMRIGLIGPNGSGKSTLLKIISGDLRFDSGGRHLAKGTTIGFLTQDIALPEEETVLDYVLNSVPGRSEIDEVLEKTEHRLSEETDNDILIELAELLAEQLEEKNRIDSFYSEYEALRILAGLGFSKEDHKRPLSEFSGGWKMRAMLSGLLFQKPDVLLLDEPTNHLDLPSVGWFSDYLKQYTRCFVLISHDREFVNEQVTSIASMEQEGLRHYPGNYDAYKKQRTLEAEILEAQAKNLAKEREHMQKFVDRFRAQANKAKAVQSRVKALNKLQDVDTYQSSRVMQFSFPPCKKAGKDIVWVRDLEKSYGEHQVLKPSSLLASRGNRIAITGANGAGKTTLLRIIASEIEASGGTTKLGRDVTAGYYAQHHADLLEEDATILQQVSQASPITSQTRIRSILGGFLFSGDDIEKPIRVLSGGERARVALAMLLTKPSNLLLLDEPTNHLDLESSESLAESLSRYDGTILFVSHNRSFVRKLATTIWNIENGVVEVYPGTMDEYMHHCLLRQQAQEDSSPSKKSAKKGSKKLSQPKKQKTSATSSNKKAQKREQANLRKQKNDLIKPIESRVKKLEDRITKLETQQEGRSSQLADPTVYDDAPTRDRLLKEFSQSQNKLQELTARWESAVEELEKAQEKVKQLESA